MGRQRMGRHCLSRTQASTLSCASLACNSSPIPPAGWLKFRRVLRPQRPVLNLSFALADQSRLHALFASDDKLCGDIEAIEPAATGRRKPGADNCCPCPEETQVRREQDKNRKWLRTLCAARPPSYRTPAPGGLMTAPPATATITAITTISMVSIASSPRMRS